MDLRGIMIQCTVICSLILSLSPAPFWAMLLKAPLPSTLSKREYLLNEGSKIWGEEAASVFCKTSFCLLGEEVLEE